MTSTAGHDPFDQGLSQPCHQRLFSPPPHLHILSLSGLIASSLSDLGKQIKQQTDKEEGAGERAGGKGEQRGEACHEMHFS